jgi:hypothetical protein
MMMVLTTTGHTIVHAVSRRLPPRQVFFEYFGFPPVNSHSTNSTTFINHPIIWGYIASLMTALLNNQLKIKQQQISNTYRTSKLKWTHLRLDFGMPGSNADRDTQYLDRFFVVFLRSSRQVRFLTIPLKFSGSEPFILSDAK